jgi:hypothetical protein
VDAADATTNIQHLPRRLIALKSTATGCHEGQVFLLCAREGVATIEYLERFGYLFPGDIRQIVGNAVL